MPIENISEEAQWFLKTLQTLQDDFAESIGAQIVTTDKNGDLVTKMSGQMRVCSDFIQKTEKGKKGCTDTYHTALGLVREMKEPAFMDCFAGYASLWVPIKVNGEIVGSITGCGGRFDRGESREEMEKKAKKLADDLGVETSEEYLKEAIDKVKVVTEEEMKKKSRKAVKISGNSGRGNGLEGSLRLAGRF